MAIGLCSRGWLFFDLPRLAAAPPKDFPDNLLNAKRRQTSIAIC